MRVIVAVLLGLTVSQTLADEIDDAHRQALRGRDDYWNCLAREYQRGDAKTMSAQDFTADVAGACPSERQNFRVALLDYLDHKYPDAADGEHLTTANRAIELAQQDIITAFVRHKAAN
ncbi:hypothetical protein [Bradyrhizobium sp.]|uniref:hypothetical protein n=1 Tax=Bradyrhizobium sp. TaxID=376 RepID=UPI001D366A04|nr:hypothetical protein [Bradyrhizobium sp.]MBV8697754.1 hypothetical protein [Bradyrhizobium sp.]MBV8919731.1 hypothetical protein [Bradyrhizobium sp.]MBV9981966.1 hypothetical protein [Bradyrhizobium sp.]